MFNDEVTNLRQLEQDWDKKQEYFQFLDGEAGTSIKPRSQEIEAVKTRDALISTGIDLSDIVTAKYLKKDKDFAYYYLPIPLTVFPPKGTTIKSVEIALQFNPGSGSERPTVHDIFPRQEWQDVVKI